MEFVFTSRDLIMLNRFYKRAPSLFKKAILGTTNNMAFGTRKVAINVIAKMMTVRNKRFVDSRLRVRKAHSGRFEAVFGSISSERFTGWPEQEFGKATGRTRVSTMASRLGNVKKQMIGQARLKPSASFIEPEDFEGQTDRFRTTAMIAYVLRTRATKSFIIRKRSQRSKFQPGLYRLVSGRIKRLQKFQTVKQPRRKMWMKRSIELYFTKTRVRNEMASAIRFVLSHYRR